MEIINGLSQVNQLSKATQNLDSYSCVFLGGSGEMYVRLMETKTNLQPSLTATYHLFDQCIQLHKPVFAICLGMQLLARYLGEQILTKDHGKGELGSILVHATTQSKQDPIFKISPNHYYVQHGHQEAVANLPKDCTLLAHNDHNSIQAFRYKDHIYAVQFHPEHNMVQQEERAKLYKEHYPEYGYDPSDMIAGLKPSTESTQIMIDFINQHHKPTS